MGFESERSCSTLAAGSCALMTIFPVAFVTIPKSY
jgi:hypothetical protein